MSGSNQEGTNSNSYVAAFAGWMAGMASSNYIDQAMEMAAKHSIADTGADFAKKYLAGKGAILSILAGGLTNGWNGVSNAAFSAAVGFIFGEPVGFVYGMMLDYISDKTHEYSIGGKIYDFEEMINDPDFWDLFDKKFDELLKPIKELNEFGGWLGLELYDFINTDVNSLFEAAKNYIAPNPRDPLTLDLDGDGIETSTVAGWNGLMFDHDADGVKEGTGWVSSDDGLLALDRNGNGVIDSGRELFGDNTLLSNGELAFDAYEALADQDGNGDGKIDASDAVFNDLRIWQDKNSDGISQADELHTLNDLGIKSISTGSTATAINQKGNAITAASTYERIDGSTGQTGSLVFGSSNFFTEFSDAIDIPDSYQGLPDMHGSGAVRNLHEASIQSSELASVLESYGSAATRDEQLALLDSLLLSWSGTSSMQTMIDRAEEENFTAIYEFGNEVATPTLSKIYSLATGGTSSSSDDAGEPKTIAEFWQQAMEPQNIAAYQKWFNILSVLERFNGEEFIEFVQPEPNSQNYMSIDPDVLPTGMGGMVSSTIFTKVSISQPRLDLLEQSYNTLRDSVYRGLLLQTRLRPFIDSIELTLADTGALAFDYSGMEALMQQRVSKDAANGVIDILEFVKYTDNELQRNGWDGWNYLGNTLRSLSITEDLQSVLDEFHLLFSSTDGVVSVGTTNDDMIVGGEGVDTIDGGNGDDIIAGVGGDDRLNGSAGNDKLYGGAGNDLLNGGDGSDAIYGEVGNDELHGEQGRDFLYGGEGDDVLGGSHYDKYGFNWVDGFRTGDYYVGGKGDDTLLGGYYNNSYEFNLGDGCDQIFEMNGGDELLFGEGIATSDIELVREGVDLVLRHINGADQVTIKNWAASDATESHIEQVVFADGTVWDHDYLHEEARHLYGTDGADVLTGSSMQAEIIIGGAGDDELHGEQGRDFLYGGEGNDVLGGSHYDKYGFNWVDGLRTGDYYVGGKGDDTLLGGYYNNSYEFNLGDGCDQIFEMNGGDELLFGEGIATSDIELVREGVDLVLRHINGADQVTIKNWAASDATESHIEQVVFADGTVWDHDYLHEEARHLYGTDGADVLTGSSMQAEIIIGGAGDDELHGEQGRDFLYGGEGNDVLGGSHYDKYGFNWVDGLRTGDYYVGGKGDDTLLGGYYNNSYEFNLGDGRDQIFEMNGGDELLFGEGIATSDIELVREGVDLVLRHINGADQVTIKNWAASDATESHIEQVVFADGTVWDHDYLHEEARHLYGTDGADVLTGSSMQAEIIIGGAGDDELHGEQGRDFLYGGEGNDVLGGSHYDKYGFNWVDGLRTGDYYVGGKGDDTLLGGYYNNSYEFNLGDGCDQIFEMNGGDELLFGEGIRSDQLWFERVVDDLKVSVIGAEDSVTITSWYASANSQIELFTTADGDVLSNTKLDQLVSAMAAFSPPASGQTTLPADMQDELMPVIASSWQ